MIFRNSVEFLFARQLHLVSIYSLNDSDKVSLGILYLSLFLLIYKSLLECLLAVFSPRHRAYPRYLLLMHLGAVWVREHPLLLNLSHVLVPDVLPEVFDLLLHISWIMLYLLHFQVPLRFLNVELGIEGLAVDLFSEFIVLFEGELLSFMLLCSSVLCDHFPNGKACRKH